MSQLQKALENGQFAITAEMAPPKGYNFTEQIEVAQLLKGKGASCKVCVCPLLTQGAWSLRINASSAKVCGTHPKMSPVGGK